MLDITYKLMNEEIEQKIMRAFGDWTKEYLEKGKNGFKLAALFMNEPVGFIIVNPSPLAESPFHVEESQIDLIEVSIKFRRCGIASKLVKQAEDWAKENNHYQIRSFFSLTKQGAFKLWYSLKYCLSPASITVPGYRKPIKGYFAVKILT
ncbi:MAG: GNAT family N-acetyltransferase [Clostridia bacterium]|nr:GNAT family N-acetyltransferase [Clostridia bacterium]